LTHPYIENAQAWALSLRQLMGYPAHTPACHSIAWCTSGPRDLLQAIQVTEIAKDMQRDLVHLAFADAVGEPVGVSLAVRQDACVEWLPARLYAATEFARIELLAGNRRWSVGSRHILTATRMPPVNRRARGEQVAMRRWRKAAAAMEHVQLEGSVLIPPSETYANAIPHERLAA
jgi:hypothetical protein